MILGLFGGTFDPIHLGHLRVAEEVCDALALDRLLFVPAKTPPHKTRATIGDAGERLEMVRSAVDGNPRFGVSDLELRRDGPSYSVETLEQLLGGANPPERLWFILGADAFGEIHTWYRYQELFGMVDIAVMCRPPHKAMPPMPEKMRAQFEPTTDGCRHRSGREVRFVEVTPLDISSTMIREAMAQGRSLRYLVPEPVRRTLEKRNQAGHHGEEYDPNR